MSSPTLSDDDDDPVVATFDVFVKPPLAANRQLLVLQYPNRASEDPSRLRSPQVAEMRLKPETGMVEVDVPLNYDTCYDRSKGMAWGGALHKSMAAKGGTGSLGLAGGFGVGSAPGRTRVTRGAGGDEDGESGPVWTEALRQDRVLRTQTLGGLSIKEKNARYMVGVFQGKNIHLTPVSSLVHLRPALHHLDAATELERASRPTAPPPPPGGREGGTARAIHMTLKSAMDDDGIATETMADRLKVVQKERWRRMEYVHDEAEAAWDSYSENLLLQPKDGGPGPAAGGVAGRGKETATQAPADTVSGDPKLSDKVPRLRTDWDEEELLRAVSGIRKDDMKPAEELLAAPTATAAATASTTDAKGKGKEKAKEEASVPGAVDKAPEPKRRPGRPPKNTSTATASKRGGRAGGRGGAAGPSSAMEID